MIGQIITIKKFKKRYSVMSGHFGCVILNIILITATASNGGASLEVGGGISCWVLSI